MLTSLSGKQVNQLLAASRAMLEAPDRNAVRGTIGPLMLDLFKADRFASFEFDHRSRTDRAPISINIDHGAMDEYAAYFQYRDPITAPMRKRAHAVHTSQVIAQPELEKTEFFNDFLARNGMCYGINYHAFGDHHGMTCHLGDLRIWRGRKREPFEKSDLDLLQAVGDLFQAALGSKPAGASEKALPPVDAFCSFHGLTRREADVLEYLAAGARDSEIARGLGISAETVRSHLKAIYQKSGMSGRASVAASLLSYLPGSAI